MGSSLLKTLRIVGQIFIDYRVSNRLTNNLFLVCKIVIVKMSRTITWLGFWDD